MTPLAADFRRAVIERAVQRRRYLHANPQIAYEETNASALVQETLAGLGLPYTVIETQNPKTGEMARTGVIVDIQGQPCPDGRMMLIRGDMDALPMTFEKSGLPHASTNEGVMHACGHDGHTAMLLATAEVLAAGRDSFRGTVRLLFQPAEEGAKGARGMVQGGALAGMDAGKKHPFVAYHNAPHIPLGTVATNPGPIMAAADYIERLVIKGRSGHVGLNFLNPLNGARQVLNLAEEIKAEVNTGGVREISLEITQMEVSKSSTSTVPAEVVMAGSLRSFDPALRMEIKKRIEDFCEGLRGQGYEIELKYRLATGPTINNPAASAMVVKAARDVFGAAAVDENFPRSFTAEDFGVYGVASPDLPGFVPFPIVFVWIGQGTGNPDSPHDQTLHRDTYDFNDDIIGTVIDLNWELVRQALPLQGPSAYEPFNA